MKHFKSTVIASPNALLKNEETTSTIKRTISMAFACPCWSNAFSFRQTAKRAARQKIRPAAHFCF
jgi:hypothetical protein